jgi:hypothetical protein
VRSCLLVSERKKEKGQKRKRKYSHGGSSPLCLFKKNGKEKGKRKKKKSLETLEWWAEREAYE